MKNKTIKAFCILLLALTLMPSVSATIVTYQNAHNFTFPVQMFGVIIAFIGIGTMILQSLKEIEKTK